MASRTLQILNLDDQKATPSILLLVFSINGVNSVDFFPDSHHADIVFDEDITSPSVIARTLEASGHRIGKPEAVKEASCCGGCCS